jgi:ABC-type amino acid transport substrate-binding protein
MVCLLFASCGAPKDAYLAHVQAAGVLRVGLDPSWPPFESIDPASGEVIGLDVDLARAIGRELGVEVAFVVRGWEGLYGALQAGQFDAILSALPYDPWRTKEALYSISYFNEGPVLVVTGAQAGAFEPEMGAKALARALAGYRVHVEFGAEGDVQARRLVDERGAAIEIQTHDSAEAALDAAAGAAAASAAAAEAAAVDAISARLYLRKHPELDLQIVGQPLYDELYVIAVHPDAASLQAAIDQVLIHLRESGELDELVARWL